MSRRREPTRRDLDNEMVRFVTRPIQSVRQSTLGAGSLYSYETDVETPAAQMDTANPHFVYFNTTLPYFSKLAEFFK